VTQWKLVPVELTEEMADAMEGRFSTEGQWAAALSASPAPPEEEVERVARALAAQAWRRFEDVDKNFALTKWPGGFEQYFRERGHFYEGDATAAISAMRPTETPQTDYKAMFEPVEKRLQECKKNLREWRLIALNDAVRNRRVAKWLSAALEDPLTCEEMKADIRAWFDAGEPVTVPTLTEEERIGLKLVRDRANAGNGYAQWGMEASVAAQNDRAFLLSLISKLMGEG
jgi:hypothetical protein